MNIIKIKYFPASSLGYLLFILVNLFFSLFFLIILFFISNENNLERKKNDLILLIPKAFSEYEEKKDLIFNQLSLNKDILSLEREDSEKVKNILYSILNNIDIEDNIIPDVYKLKIKNKSDINLESLNAKINIIDRNAKVFFTNYQNKKFIIISYSFLFIVIVLFLLSNYFFTKFKIIKIRKYLVLSRNFGVSDITLIKNLNIGYIFLTIISYLLCYIIVFILLDQYISQVFSFYVNKTIFIILFLFCLLSIIIDLSLQLRIFLKKLL